MVDSSNNKRPPTYRMPPHDIKEHLAHLSEQCLQDSERWFGDVQEGSLVRDIPYLALAMCGEAGEFANVVKKIQRGSLPLKDPKTHLLLAGELTDVLVYLLNIAGAMGIDLQKSYDLVRGQNEKRFMEEREHRDDIAKLNEH